mgnify:CR=1 FL=1
MSPLTKPLHRKTAAKASSYGADASRQIVVSLVPAPNGDDLVQLRPLRCQQRTYAITVKDLWSFLQKVEANKAWSERMTATKQAKADAKERARLLRSIRSK